MSISKILTFLSVFFVCLLNFPLSAHAASPPSANLSLTRDKHYALLTFSNLTNVARVSYTLTYTSNRRVTGFEGGFKTQSRTVRTTRRQIIGSCSTRHCVFHPLPQNFNLDVTFTLKSGGTTTLHRSL